MEDDRKEITKQENKKDKKGWTQKCKEGKGKETGKNMEESKEGKEESKKKGRIKEKKIVTYTRKEGAQV